MTEDRPAHRGLLRPALVVGLIVVALLALWLADHTRQDTVSGRTAGPPASTRAPAGATTRPSDPAALVTFAVVGDSITEADSPGIDEARSAAGSWTFYAVDQRVGFVGGWARSGATTRRMAESVPTLGADCLVILAGTNDISQDVPFARSADNLRSIVSTAGIETVIVSAIPPFDPDPQAAVSYNRELAGLAAAEGWTFTDPMADLRAGDRFRSSASGDGVHPTQEGARMIGEELRAEVLRVCAAQ